MRQNLFSIMETLAGVIHQGKCRTNATQLEIAGLDCKYDNHYQFCEKMLTGDLEESGYRLTVRFVKVSNKYKIFELLHVDSSRAARKCFLTSDIRSHGVVLPGPFHEYVATVRSAPVIPSLIQIVKIPERSPWKIPFNKPAPVGNTNPGHHSAQRITSGDARYYVVDA